MAASIRSWIKDRLTRYEAKNKVDLVPSPGAEVQVEKWLTFESPYWARVCDREHSIVIRVSDEAAQKFFDQYELACTTLLRGIISITPFQPIIVRLRPGYEPQLALDVKGFNTKAMGGDVLHFQGTKELAEEPWACEWSRRIAQAHPELTSGVVRPDQAKAAGLVPSMPTGQAEAIRKPLRLPDESRVNFLELGWCLIRPDQQEILDRDFPDPPVPAKYAHLFPGCSVIPDSIGSTSKPTARPRADPLHLEDDDQGSDDELAIKPPPARITSLKRPVPPTEGVAQVDGGERPTTFSSPPAERAPPGSSQSHTVTNSSPSHFSASQDQRNVLAGKRARTSLGTAPQGSKVLVAASDSDTQSQETRIESQARSGGPRTSSGSGGAGQALTSSSSASGGLRGYPALTASTMDEPPFTLAQHTVSLQGNTPSTSTPDDNPRRQQPYLSLEAGSAPVSSSEAQLTATQMMSSIGRTQVISFTGDGDVDMRVPTVATEVTTEVITSPEDESADLALKGARVEPPSQVDGPSQNTEADESRTDDEDRIGPMVGLSGAAPTLAAVAPAADAGGPIVENAEMHEEEGAPAVELAAKKQTGTLPDVLSRVQSGVRSLLQPIVAAADMLPAALQPTARLVEKSQQATNDPLPINSAIVVKPSSAAEASPVQRGLTGSSAGDADAVDALTQSASPVVPVTVADKDTEIVADSQPPSRTRSQADLSLGPELDSLAEAGGSVSVSQMPPRREPSPPAQRRPAQRRQPTPPQPIQAPPSLPVDEPEVVDLRSASPEISIISPPASSRLAAAPVNTRGGPSNGARLSTGGPSSIAPPTAASVHPPPPPSSSAPPRPPPPPPAPAPRPMPAYQPPKPSFTLSRTLDLPPHHGLPMLDDVMDILRRAQAFQSRRSR